MLEQLILALCINMQTPDLSKYYPSCQYALTAASLQINLKPKVDQYQQDIEKIIEKRTGQQVWIVVGFVYSAFMREQFIFSVNVRPVADNLSVDLNRTNQTASLVWSF